MILNACGGRLKSCDLLCAEYNSRFGNSFDFELAKNTNTFSNILRIKRERGEPQVIVGKFQETGEDALFTSGKNPRLKKPLVKETRTGNQMHVSIKANDSGELKKILAGLKRKHPGIDIKKLLENQRKDFIRKDVGFRVSIGSSNDRKSITKTAINYFILNKGDRKYISHIVPYLNGETELGITWLYYPNEPTYIAKEKEFSHVLKLIGDPEKRMLFCHVEIFNVYNFIALLNESYDGKKIDQTYCFDVCETKLIDDAQVKLEFNVNQLYNSNQSQLQENMDARLELFLRKISLFKHP